MIHLQTQQSVKINGTIRAVLRGYSGIQADKPVFPDRATDGYDGVATGINTESRESK